MEPTLCQVTLRRSEMQFTQASFWFRQIDKADDPKSRELELVSERKVNHNSHLNQSLSRLQSINHKLDFNQFIMI